MSGLQFVAAILNSLAWPVAAVAAVALLRKHLSGALYRMRSVEFGSAKATFDSLAGIEKISEAAARTALSDYEKAADGLSDHGRISGPPGSEAIAADRVIARSEEVEFSVLNALAQAAPQQAIIDAWGLLEYQLNVASDRIAPNSSHTWPQVTRNLEAWDKWPGLYPVVAELRRLRDETAGSGHPVQSSDAARYVSVVQDLVTTLRASFAIPSKPDERPGVPNGRAKS